MQNNYSYNDIRKWLLHFRTLDYSKNRKDLIDTLIYKVVLYDEKVKILFHLKGGQKGELLLNLIFPDYPDGNADDGENAKETPQIEKETDKSVSQSSGCAYTPVMVEVTGLAPVYRRKTIELSPCAVCRKSSRLRVRQTDPVPPR